MSCIIVCGQRWNFLYFVELVFRLLLSLLRTDIVSKRKLHLPPSITSFFETRDISSTKWFFCDGSESRPMCNISFTAPVNLFYPGNFSVMEICRVRWSWCCEFCSLMPTLSGFDFFAVVSLSYSALIRMFHVFCIPLKLAAVFSQPPGTRGCGLTIAHQARKAMTGWQSYMPIFLQKLLRAPCISKYRPGMAVYRSWYLYEKAVDHSLWIRENHNNA